MLNKGREYYLGDQVINSIMNYSSTYFAVIVAVVAEVLKFAGFEVGNEAITTTVLTLVQVASALWVLWQRFLKGGISIFGVKE